MFNTTTNSNCNVLTIIILDSKRVKYNYLYCGKLTGICSSS